MALKINSQIRQISTPSMYKECEKSTAIFQAILTRNIKLSDDPYKKKTVKPVVE